MVKLQKSVQITLIVVIAAVILTVILVAALRGNSLNNTIQVNGQASTKVSPDLISVYFSVDTKGATSQLAEDANSVIVEKLKNNIVALGFKETDLTTENYAIYPEYDYSGGSQRLTGYRATHSLKIEVSAEEKSKVSSIIDAGTNAGAGISYINFELSPSLEQTAKTAAIKNASDDAKVKAEAIAEGFDKRLGRLVSVSLNEFNYSPWPIFAARDSGVSSGAEAKTAVSGITPSNQEVSASITAVYRLM